MNSCDIRVHTDEPTATGDRGQEHGLRRSVDGEALFGGWREIDIHFGQSVYHLRITRQGKLILNK